MLRRAALKTVFFVSMFIASTATADVPLPPDLHYVDPSVRLEGVDQYPDYVFHLRYLTFTGAPTVPYRVIEVKSSKAFPLNAERRLSDMRLLALKRDVFERRKKADPSLAWLNDKTDGVLEALVDAPSTVAPKNKPVPVTAYRVLLKDGKLTAEMLETAEDKQKSLVVGGWPTLISGLGLSAACAAIGLWIVRTRSTWRDIRPAAVGRPA